MPCGALSAVGGALSARGAFSARALFQKCYGFVHCFKSAMVLCTFSKVLWVRACGASVGVVTRDAFCIEVRKSRCPLRISVRSRRAVGGLSTRLGWVSCFCAHSLHTHLLPTQSVHTHSFTPTETRSRPLHSHPLVHTHTFMIPSPFTPTRSHPLASHPVRSHPTPTPLAGRVALRCGLGARCALGARCISRRARAWRAHDFCKSRQN